jgi:hypothetical protein
MMGFIVEILSNELLKYNPGITGNEAIHIVQTVVSSHEGEPDTGTLWLSVIHEIDNAAHDYLTNKVLENGRENQNSTKG